MQTLFDLVSIRVTLRKHREVEYLGRNTLLTKNPERYTTVVFEWSSEPDWVQKNLIFGGQHNIHFLGSARESINRVNGRAGYDRRWNPEVLGKQLAEALFEIDGVKEVVFLNSRITVKVAFRSDGQAMHNAIRAEAELEVVFAKFNERLELVTSPI